MSRYLPVNLSNFGLVSALQERIALTGSECFKREYMHAFGKGINGLNGRARWLSIIEMDWAKVQDYAIVSDCACQIPTVGHWT